MTVQKLLTPRVKVIALMPLVNHEVGEILPLDVYGFVKLKLWSDEHATITVKATDYSANLKEILWYHDRKKSDMPEYVKLNIEGGGGVHTQGREVDGRK